MEQRSDIESIGRNAKDETERRLALDSCLIYWSDADIARLVRRDDSWHGWEMARIP